MAGRSPSSAHSSTPRPRRPEGVHGEHGASLRPGPDSRRPAPRCTVRAMTRDRVEQRRRPTAAVGTTGERPAAAGCRGSPTRSTRWEPVAGSWNVPPRTARRPARQRPFAIDWELPGPRPREPVTTIAWRIAASSSASSRRAPRRRLRAAEAGTTTGLRGHGGRGGRPARQAYAGLARGVARAPARPGWPALRARRGPVRRAAAGRSRHPHPRDVHHGAEVAYCARPPLRLTPRRVSVSSTASLRFQHGESPFWCGESRVS